MVIGYPRGFSDSLNNLPIIRNAIISSAYGVNFQGNPYFIMDANLHPGMSGSPVITKPKNTWQRNDGSVDMLTGAPMYFLGIHSGTFGIQLQSGKEPLGLGTVWYARLIEEIIDAMENMN